MSRAEDAVLFLHLALWFGGFDLVWLLVYLLIRRRRASVKA